MTAPSQRHSLDHWLAAAIGAGTLLVLVATLDRPLMTWDEGYTIRREAHVREWFGMLNAPPQPGMRSKLFDEQVIHEFWQFAREEPDGHPPFYAIIGNVGWLAGHRWLPLIEAHRLGPVLLFSFTVGVMYLFVARRFSRLAGAASAGSWVFMPRVFAHAHLASYDIPLACLWVLVVVTFWKARESWVRSFGRGLAWSVIFAITLALAAATKFTGWLIPIPLLIWSIAAGLRTLRRDGKTALKQLAHLALLACLWLITVPEVIRLMRELSRTEYIVSHSPRHDFRDSQERFTYVASALRRSSSGWLPLAATMVPPALWAVAAIAARRLKSSPDWLRPSPTVACWTASVGLAPTLTLLLVPNWWSDPLRGIAIFLWSNLTRQQTTFIPTRFFGTLYEFSLPWYNTLAWVGLTVPPIVLLLIVMGVVGTATRRSGSEVRGSRIEERERSAGQRADSSACNPQFSILGPQSLAWLLLLNAATLLVIRALPGAPGHDGERQLLGSFPFLACLAGVGAEFLRAWLARWRGAVLAAWLVGGLVAATIGSAAAATWHYRSAPLSYYTELIGGVRGAAKLGLEPTYYWDALDRPAVEWLNSHTPGNERVLFCNYPATLDYLRQAGELRVEIRPDRPGEWRWYVLQNRPGLFAETPWNRWLAEHGRPAFTRELDGVPLIWIFPFEEYEKARQATRRDRE